MLQRSVLVAVRASAASAHHSAGAAAASTISPAAVCAVQCAAASSSSSSVGALRHFASEAKAQSTPRVPNLPSAGAAAPNASSGLDRAEYRPEGRTRGYTSTFDELQARARVLANNRAVYNNVVHDALSVEAAEKRQQRYDTAQQKQKQSDDDRSQHVGSSFKQQAMTSRYTNAEIPGYAFQSPKHLNDPRAIHGVGTPAQKLVQRPRPRRETYPKGVQNVPTPMKTFTDGPRELGNKIVRTYIGHVVSDKMQKTVAVEVSQYYRHPKYHKYIKTSKKFLTHDEEEECNLGDVVEIRVCRPLSRRKHFTLHRILKPKLLIEEGARRFEEHLPEWRKLQLVEGGDAAAVAQVELASGEEALRLEKQRRDEAAAAADAKAAADRARPAEHAAAKAEADRLEDVASVAARLLTEFRGTLPPNERLVGALDEEGKPAKSQDKLIKLETDAITKAAYAVAAREKADTIKSKLKVAPWASS